jgi:sugar phosphate isomerase/epimerase
MLKLATKFAPRPSAFETAYATGFRNAEFWLDAAILADWPTVVQHARQYPLSYALHFPNRLDLNSDTLHATVELCRGLNCNALVIHQPMYDKYHAALLRLEPELRLAVENHKLSLDGFAAWAEHNPGLALDVEHLWKFTLRDGPLHALLEQVRTFLTRYGNKLRHVHLPGYWPGFAEHRPLYCAREMVFPVLSLLAEAGFEGLVVSEVSPEFQNRYDLRMDVLLYDHWCDMHKR